ncbi:MAG: cell division protein FtsZ, partial [Actinomycetota bacterium]|nr:cell division protein FtsZ [Actinomycetota bacterium]
GEDRAVQAAEYAISSPLLEASIDGAQGVLLSIQGGSDLGLFEINEAAKLVQEAAHPEANIIFGAVIDDALGDEVRVTVIAAGFDSATPQRRADDRGIGQIQGGPTARQQPTSPGAGASPVGQSSGHQGGHPGQAPGNAAQQNPARQDSGNPSAQGAPAGQRVGDGGPSQQGHQGQQGASQGSAARPPRQVPVEPPEDLDVPDFLK